MDGMTAPPVFSAYDLVAFTPPGSPRTYRLAPLTYRERIAFRAALAREAGMRPSPQDVSNGLRAALREVAPTNIDEALAVVDEADAAREAADAAPNDAALKAKLAEAQAQLAVIITACMDVPAYAELRAAGERWIGMAPWVACRHALRGWDGPGLPVFRRDKGLVLEELLDVLPASEVTAVGWRAFLLVSLDRSAEGNSAAPSPSPETQTPSPEG
jgi:hypothetical protein